ncbi:uncharacterized protein LOC115218496 [Argonauta hians]
MFVPRVRLHYNDTERPVFSSRRRRPKRKVRRPFKLADFINIPCLLPTLIGTLIGFLISIGGIAMSILGYYPESSILNQNIRLPMKPPEPPRNIHLKVLAYIGPPIMAMGAFMVIVSCVMYCEFRDKYLRVEDEIRIRSLKKEAIYELVVESFRRNYFRGIQLPFQQMTVKSTNSNELTSSSDSNMCSNLRESGASNDTAYKITFPASSRRSSMVTHPIKRSEIANKAYSMPNIKPFHNALSSAFISHVSYTRRKSNNVAFDDYRLARGCDIMRRSSVVSSSVCSVSTGIINPAYEQDDDMRDDDEAADNLAPNTQYLCVHQNRPMSEGDSSDSLPVVIVHMASVHQVDAPDSRRPSVNTVCSGCSTSPQLHSSHSGGVHETASNVSETNSDNASDVSKPSENSPHCISHVSIDSNSLRSMLTSSHLDESNEEKIEKTDLQNIEMKEVSLT